MKKSESQQSTATVTLDQPQPTSTQSTQTSLLECCVAETVTKPTQARQVELSVRPQEYCCGVWKTKSKVTIKLNLNPDGTVSLAEPVTLGYNMRLS